MDLRIIEKIEKRYRFRFLPLIEFESLQAKRDIRIRGMNELKRGRIHPKALTFGQKYRSQIESAFFFHVEIRWIHRRIGYGLFALEPLKSGQFLGECTGVVRANDRRHFEPLNNYCFEYPVPDSIGRSHVIDASSGNWSRFINHSDRPNLKIVHGFIDGFFHLILITLRHISVGEQLSFDYGPNYWYLRPKPYRIS